MPLLTNSTDVDKHAPMVVYCALVENMGTAAAAKEGNFRDVMLAGLVTDYPHLRHACSYVVEPTLL